VPREPREPRAGCRAAREAESPDVIEVILYTKPGCHLCEPVGEVIRAAQSTRAFAFTIRNILDDAADFERYKNDIPVVTVNGTEIARHRLSPQRFQFALDEAAVR
jgi:hypothetical protein